MADWRPLGERGSAAVCAGAAFLVCTLFSAQNAAAAGFTGRYDGTGPAAGLAMVLSENGNEVHGRIAAAGKDIYLLNGQANGNVATGHLTSPGAFADFKIEWQPSTVVFTLTPLLGNGAPNSAAQKQYAFVRGKANSPALANYHVEPPRRGESVDITRFLESYRGWMPKEVAIGYSGLSDLDRALINDYSHLQADLMNRLCRGDAPRASLMTVSEHQDVDCDTLTALVDKGQATHQISSFNVEADNQRSALYSVVACMHNLYSADRCADIGAEPKRAAQNWQSAGRIFADISSYGARSGALIDEVLESDPGGASRDVAPQKSVTPPIRESAPTPSALAPPPAPTAAAPVASPPAKVASAPKASRTPVPRVRPSELAGVRALEGQKVDESVLASIDQSTEITPRKHEESYEAGFGFDLRPSSGDIADPAPTVLAGPGASGPRSQPVPDAGAKPVPVPRPKQRPPTSG